MNADASRALPPMSAQQASQLLSAVLGRQASPLDRLLARCGASDGGVWSSHVLQSHDRKTKTLDGCRALKDEAKVVLASPSEEGHDPASFLCYLLAIAAASDLHGTTISSAAPLEVVGGLTALAPFLPAPWSDMFLRAAQRIRDQVV